MKHNSPKTWFGPKRIGIGFSPRTWEGWLITAAVVVAIILVANFGTRR